MRKLSNQSVLYVLPRCFQAAPIALSLLAGSFAFGQTVQNRYTAPNPYSVPSTPVYTYQAQAPTFQSAPPVVHYHPVQPSYNQPLPAAALRYTTRADASATIYETIPPQRPATVGQAAMTGRGASNPSKPVLPNARASGLNPVKPNDAPKPVSPMTPNFADVQEIGRGLGTPGLITPGSVQRMEQSGLVVEDFRPPQPRQEDISLEGLPPEARRAFYDQLQLPDGGRVMSARVLSSDSVPPATEAKTVPADQVPEAEESSSLVQPTPESGSTASEAQPETKQNLQLAPSEPNPSVVSEERESSRVLEDRYTEQREELQVILEKLTQQNISISTQLSSINERLTKLEQANQELEKKLRETTEAVEKVSGEEKSKGDREGASRSESDKDKDMDMDKGKDKAPEKKSKRKPKDRIEV